MSGDLPEGLELLGELGRGGFGRVQRVRRRRDGVELALKWVEGSDPARAVRELDAAFRIDHENLLRCHATGSRGNRAWLLLELADGTVREHLGDPSRLGECWRWLCQAGRGLAHLHARGYVHRDVKPENVFVVDGVGKIGDLGLIRGGDYRTLTATGVIMGTPGFLAPEQVLGAPADGRTDLFALAVCFYRLIEGRLPYRSREPAELVMEVARGELLPLEKGERLLPEPAREALRRGLDPDPSGRPGKIGSWAEVLLAHPPRPDRKPAASTRVLAAPRLSSGRLTPGRSGAQRTRRRAGARLALLLLACLGAGWALSGEPPPPPAPAPAPTEPASPFGEDFPARLRACSRAVLDELDALEGDPGLEYRDPLQWTTRLEEWPETAEVIAWLMEGGRPEVLPEEVEAAMRQLDNDLRGVELPAPFHPALYARPSSARISVNKVLPDSIRVHLRHGTHEILPGTLEGWVASGVKAIAAAARLHRRQWSDINTLLDGQAVDSVPWQLREAHTYHLSRILAGSRTRSPPNTWAHTHAVFLPTRVHLGEYLEPGVRLMHEALWCFARAVEEGGEAAELAAVLARAGTADCPLYWISRLSLTPPEILLAETGDSPSARYLDFVVLRSQNDLQRVLSGTRKDVQSGQLAACREALAPGGWGPFARQRWSEALASTLKRVVALQGAGAGMALYAEHRERYLGLGSPQRGTVMVYLLEALEQRGIREGELDAGTRRRLLADAERVFSEWEMQEAARSRAGAALDLARGWAAAR